MITPCPIRPPAYTTAPQQIVAPASIRSVPACLPRALEPLRSRGRFPSTAPSSTTHRGPTSTSAWTTANAPTEVSSPTTAFDATRASGEISGTDTVMEPRGVERLLESFEHGHD